MLTFDPSISSAVRVIRRRRSRQESIVKSPLSPEMLDRMHRYWCAADYLTIGQIYLKENPLLREPLQPRVLGHWGTSPGLSFIASSTST
jgi:xylulose-5-phosphate/fructose-6-phosphate phosphoketolase